MALMSAGWADAVASAPKVVSARIATKATVLLRRPAIMAFTNHVGRAPDARRTAHDPSAVPTVDAHPLLSRFAPRGFVTLRQTFVRRCHLGWTASEPPHFSRNGTVAPPPQRRKQRRTNETPPTSGNSQMGEEPFLNWNAPPIVLNDGAQPGRPAAADRGAAHAGQSWTCGWCSTAPPSATGSARAASRAANGRGRGREDRGADQGRAAADQQPQGRLSDRSTRKPP